MKPTVSRDPRAGDPLARRAAAAGIVLATATVYAGTLAAPLIYDDRVWITGNPSIRRLGSVAAVLWPGEAAVRGRPVLSLSLALSHALSGEAPWGYHLANLAIHVLAALALFGIVARTLAFLPERFPAARDRILFAFAVALLWAVHPLQTESVTYASQRSESLMGLLYLLTLYAFIRGAQAPERGAWLLLSVAACALGMATKEVMATAPLIVLAYDRTFVAGSLRGALRQRRGFYAGLASTWLVLALLSAGAGAAWATASGTPGGATRSRSAGPSGTTLSSHSGRTRSSSTTARASSAAFAMRSRGRACLRSSSASRRWPSQGRARSGSAARGSS